MCLERSICFFQGTLHVNPASYGRHMHLSSAPPITSYAEAQHLPHWTVQAPPDSTHLLLVGHCAYGHGSATLCCANKYCVGQSDYEAAEANIAEHTPSSKHPRQHQRQLLQPSLCQNNADIISVLRPKAERPHCVRGSCSGWPAAACSSICTSWVACSAVRHVSAWA